MADAHSTCICRLCGSEFVRQKKAGRPATLCEACSAIKRAGKGLASGYRTCNGCGKEFHAKPNQTYCSDKCRFGRELLTRDQYRESVRKNAKQNFICINCGKSSSRKISGSNHNKGYENKFCSMSCRVEHSAIIREKRSLLKRELSAIRRLGKTDYKPTKKRSFCKSCGAMFIATLGGGLHKQKCDDCISSTNKIASKIAKALRRARIKGVEFESVNPFSVFDRDGWKCKLCGAKTPRSKRGTYDDDAPELDHIIPLSKGGSHTYKNTQCSCRKCNQLKGDKPLGQMLLIG